MIANLNRFVSLRDWVHESFELVEMPYRPAQIHQSEACRNTPAISDLAHF